jgi:hypothetical protein
MTTSHTQLQMEWLHFGWFLLVMGHDNQMQRCLIKVILVVFKKLQEGVVGGHFTLDITF